MDAQTALELLDYRREVFQIYRQVRGAATPSEAALHFRQARDRLFASHPQSALSAPQKAAFKGLSYYPYNPAYRFRLPVDRLVEPAIFELNLDQDGLFRYQRVGKIHFELEGVPLTLSLFWILGYGGGLFLPCRDLTNQDETYGGGRYLLDTLKGADLGNEGDRLVIDFNFAYNPSCAYNDRWHCPLPPQENWLPVPIRAGEKAFSNPA